MSWLRRKTLFLLLLTAMMIFFGCAADEKTAQLYDEPLIIKKDEQPDKADEMDEVDEEEGEEYAGAEDDTKETEDDPEEKETEPIAKDSDEKPDGDILRFRDVYGVGYETVINRDIPANPYNNDSFVHEGNKVKYLDRDYMLGVDVSHHQGNIDWEKVKADGYGFAILRIGYRGYGTGSLNEDKEFENYYRGAKDAGLLVGAYFFSQAINEDEAKEEAIFVLDMLEGRPMDLPVVYDPESILDDESRTDNVTGEQFTKNTKVFCRTIEENGYQPMIYSNMLWEAFELDLTQLAGYPMWYADYEDVPQTPYMFDIWQYSNEGSVSGVDGACDLDIYFL